MQTYDELQDKINQLQEQANAVKEKEKAEAIADMKKRIAKYGITATELGLTLKVLSNEKPVSAKPIGAAKYRDPKTGKTWPGRGPRPEWLKAEIEAGRKLEDFLIDRQDTGH
jgi:DNA-binding protein H-NS